MKKPKGASKAPEIDEFWTHKTGAAVRVLPPDQEEPDRIIVQHMSDNKNKIIAISDLKNRIEAPKPLIEFLYKNK